MSASLTWSGLEELKAALRALPAALAAEGGHIVEGAANGALAEVKRNYTVRLGRDGPRSTAGRPGDLRDKLDVRKLQTGPFGVAVVLRYRDKAAAWFENGTQVRHTARGLPRGRMPPRPTFIPAVRAARRLMYGQLAELVRRQGLEVSGNAE